MATVLAGVAGRNAMGCRGNGVQGMNLLPAGGNLFFCESASMFLVCSQGHDGEIGDQICLSGMRGGGFAVAGAVWGLRGVEHDSG